MYIYTCLSGSEETFISDVQCWCSIVTLRETLYSAYAKSRLSQVNVRQNLSATGRNFGFTCHHDNAAW